MRERGNERVTHAGAWEREDHPCGSVGTRGPPTRERGHERKGAWARGESLWCTYGRRSNMAYVIGTDGQILLRQEWNDPNEMEALILEYLGQGM